MDDEIDDKIIFALERLSNLFKHLLWDVTKELKLSPIQIKFLSYLYSHPKKFCRVSQLAKEFELTQATVSDAVKSLEDKGLIRKKVSLYDKRVYNLTLTLAGKKLAIELLRWPNSIKKHLKNFPIEKKEVVFLFLMELVKSLQDEGLIQVIRMCLTCKNFSKINGEFPYYCSLTGRKFSNKDLNIECIKHIRKD